MELLMDTENIIGLMEVFTKGISNMEFATVMESGPINTANKFTKEAIEWIKSRDMEYINGLPNKHTKVILEKTIEMDLVSCTR